MSNAALYTVSDYLLDRLAQLGVEEIFGVPGDFNLTLLDHVVAHNDLRWVGNANELNAGYAADGYARIRGIGAVATTYGVGELSLVNATAGSYAEHVPVVHVVGVPSTDIQAHRQVVHHTLADGDFDHFRRIASEVSVAWAHLSAVDAREEIDRVLRQVVTYRRPGYLMLPTDVARTPCARPAGPMPAREDFSSVAAQKAFAQAASDFLSGQEVTVLADLLVHRTGGVANLRQLLTAHSWPFATLTWGKTLIDEHDPQFMGLYAGAASAPEVREAIEGAHRLVLAGVTFNDSTTAGFTQSIDPRRTIDIGWDRTIIGGDQVFAPLSLPKALAILRQIGGQARPAAVPQAIESPPQKNLADTAAISQDIMWPIVAAGLRRAADNAAGTGSEAAQPHRQGNIVVADQGTAFYGLATERLPEGTTFIGQPQWGSIGYALPAALGAALAARDRRAVLVIGDGAAQLTIQELGTWLREKVHGVVMLLNNDGYTIERAIQGPKQIYNDITSWNWGLLPAAFGGTAENVLVLRAETIGELRQAARQAGEVRDKLVFLEIVLGREDYPPLLRELAASAQKANA